MFVNRNESEIFSKLNKILVKNCEFCLKNDERKKFISSESISSDVIEWVGAFNNH